MFSYHPVDPAFNLGLRFPLTSFSRLQTWNPHKLIRSTLASVPPKF
uniref:Uncharacterized protein n=1 Tax=Utricularia reniformis TaxID=192314 RepID=A0A1Y0B4I7_9LAMI|nr:hypothetical protein AEK19_MT2147 [Utricularia reniformis]ART32297.1 hypothetical protein AEK19_MT2147 [Utricularia reniformis]